MTSILRNAAVGVAFASLGDASAASAATDQATVNAQILEALTVTVNAGANALNFGAIAESGAGGTVTVAVNNTQTCSAGLVCDGLTAVPTFDVQGVANKIVNVSFVNATEQLAGPGGATMQVGSFTSSASQLTLNGLGQNNFQVGGTLAVAAGQTPGVYTGNVTVAVVYN